MTETSRTVNSSYSSRQNNQERKSSTSSREGKSRTTNDKERVEDSYRRIMKSEHEHFMRCKMCPKNSAIYEKASNAVIDSLMSICHEFKSGYTNNLKALHKNLELQLQKIPKTAESDIVAIKLHTIEYIIELNQWSGYLRGENPEKPSNIKYSERYQLDIGEWVKCTILPCMLNPLKRIIETLPKLNAPTRTYPLNELQEMFMYIEAMIGMMNYCEEEESSPEGSYLGFAVLAVDQLQRLVCPKEIRPGHVILECQRIAQAYAEFFKRMCNAAWALGFKVENRDRNEIDLEDELSKVIPPVKTSTSKESIAAQLPSQSTTIQESAYANPVANEIINDPGCELFNDTEGLRLTGESVVSICEDFSCGHLHGREFSEVSRTPSLYPYWVMAEGAREIKEIWKLTPFYLGKIDMLPQRTKLLSKYLDWNCNYSFWQAIDKFYRAAIQGNVKYKDSDIMMIHYLGIVYGKSIKLINDFHGQWLECDLNKLGNHLYAFLKPGQKEKVFLADQIIEMLKAIQKWVRTLHNKLPAFELSRLRGDKPAQAQIEAEVDIKYRREDKEDTIAEKVAAKLREQPLDARLVDVAPSAGKSLRAAMKDPGGRPKKTNGGAKVITQKRIAKMFGPPCTINKVANWEAKARGANRGSVPPSAVYNGRLESYREELRKLPIGENVDILTAIINQYKATEGVKEAIDRKRTIHCRTDETLAKASGQIDEALRRKS